ncbi:MAG: preprotein translocase subunit SecE [Deltaproteobacteria bacterium]|nr:preprotein translocase subunit SecE [Deltaproteobacteria bacterium]
MSPKKWVNLSFALASLLLVLVFKQVLDVVWDTFRLPVSQLPLNWSTMIGVVLGVLVFFGLQKTSKVVLFMSEVVLELSKVTWPVKKETALSAVIVAIMVGIASVIMFLFDTVWGSLTQKFLAS